jgi:hypothetical protein
VLVFLWKLLWGRSDVDVDVDVGDSRNMRVCNVGVTQMEKLRACLA